MERKKNKFLEKFRNFYIQKIKLIKKLSFIKKGTKYRKKSKAVEHEKTKINPIYENR